MIWCQIASRDHQNKRVINFLVSSFSSPFFPFPPPSPSSNPLRPPPFLSPIPCPFIITPSLPLVSWLAGSRWRGREGGRDVGKEGWRMWGRDGGEEWGRGLLSSVPLFIPSQCRQTVCFHISHSQTVHGSVSVGRCWLLRLTWRMKCLK